MSYFFLKHEQYNATNLKNDIALVTLADELVFNEHIQPACLPSKSFSYPDIGSRGIIAGWGLTKNRDKSSVPDLLQNVGVNIYESSRCDLVSGNYSVVVTSESQICLGKLFILIVETKMN